MQFNCFSRTCTVLVISMESLANLETEFIDQLAERWHTALVPFFGKEANSPKGSTKGVIFGTGFFINWNSSLVLVTAAHVIETARNYSVVILNVNGHGVLLSNRKFRVFEDSDIAISIFDFNELQQAGVGKIKVIPIATDRSGQEAMSRYVGMGFPATQNQLNTAYKKLDRTSLIFSLFPAAKGQSSETLVPNPLLLEYEPLRMKPGVNRPKNSTPPDIHGVSGGPVFQLFAFEKPDHGIHIGLELAGILVEWRTEEQHLIAAKTSDLIELLECP